MTIFKIIKEYNIPKAQLVIADIPYNLSNNAYASNPSWYVGGDNKKGESNKANKSFFDTDEDFRIAEFFHFCSKLLIKEPKEKGKSPAMIVFCSFEQLHMVMEYGKKYGFVKSYPLIFIKNYSSQVLKANMKIVGATEHNLRNIDVSFPLGRFIAITGVSGSGKSTLMTDILANALNRRFYRAKVQVGAHKEIKGLDNINKVINIDQSPIGRTPRSNPATYTGAFTPIRELFCFFA